MAYDFLDGVGEEWLGGPGKEESRYYSVTVFIRGKVFFVADVVKEDGEVDGGGAGVGVGSFEEEDPLGEV